MISSTFIRIIIIKCPSNTQFDRKIRLLIYYYVILYRVKAEGLYRAFSACHCQPTIGSLGLSPFEMWPQTRHLYQQIQFIWRKIYWGIPSVTTHNGRVTPMSTNGYTHKNVVSSQLPFTPIKQPQPQNQLSLSSIHVILLQFKIIYTTSIC